MSSFNRVDTTANRLLMAMDLRGMSQSALSRATGIDRGSISHYRKGKYEPKQNAIYKLARALDVSEMWLWGYDCNMERTPEHKKNDTISDAVIRMMNDPEFYDLIESLYSLDEGKLDAVKQLLSAFIEQPND